MPPDKRSGPEVTTPRDRRNADDSSATTTDTKVARRDWRALWEPLRAQAKVEASRRRTRVLAHADLAARLCEPPLGYARPEQWSGYVPPKLMPDNRVKGPPRMVLNDSPRRLALVELCSAALAREREAEVTS
jgi:hypothetical protein